MAGASMMRYTRFPPENLRDSGSTSKRFERRIAETEQLLRRAPELNLSQDDRTSRISKQIVQDEADNRQALTEALRAARLERAGRFSKLESGKKKSKSER